MAFWRQENEENHPERCRQSAVRVCVQPDGAAGAENNKTTQQQHDPSGAGMAVHLLQLRCQRAGHGGVRCKDEHRKQPDLSFGAACVRSEPSGDGEAGQDGLQQWQ